MRESKTLVEKEWERHMVQRAEASSEGRTSNK